MDRLVQAVVELRVTLRICFAIIGLGFPLLTGLIVFLVVQSFSTSAKVDRLSDQLATVRGDYDRLSDRIDKLERPARP